MARRPAPWPLLLTGALALAAPLAAQEPDPEASPPAAEEEPRADAARNRRWYPARVQPPKGTQYPCELTPLPRDLAGFPEADHLYVDHVFSMVLKATHAKLTLLEGMRTGKLKGAKLTRAHAAYERELRDALEKIRAETPPAGLEGFQEDLLAGLEAQRSFFTEAVDQVAKGKHPEAFNAIWNIPAGRQGSQRLIAAWNKIAGHYGNWPGQPATKDSVFHHLCALDLF